MAVTQEKAINILKSVQVIGTLTSCIDIETTKDITDTRFKHPTINNHKRRLKESIKGIDHYVASIASVKDRDEFNYEFAVEMHRLVSHFCGLTTDQLRDFMDKVDEEIAKNTV